MPALAQSEGHKTISVARTVKAGSTPRVNSKGLKLLNNTWDLASPYVVHPCLSSHRCSEICQGLEWLERLEVRGLAVRLTGKWSGQRDHWEGVWRNEGTLSQLIVYSKVYPSYPTTTLQQQQWWRGHAAMRLRHPHLPCLTLHMQWCSLPHPSCILTHHLPPHTGRWQWCFASSLYMWQRWWYLTLVLPSPTSSIPPQHDNDSALPSHHPHLLCHTHTYDKCHTDSHTHWLLSRKQAKNTN